MEELKFTPWNVYWDKKEFVDVPGRGKFNIYSTSVESNWVMVCIHGAGHSGLSFSLLAEALRGTCSVYAPDLKCHGDTEGDPAKDLSIENLTQDCVEICKLYKQEGKKLLILGHSLGGCIATRASKIIKPTGLFVIDTIEGIATSSMPRMRFLLNSRPKSFKSENEAIRYISCSGEMSSSKSAAVSSQGRIVKKGDEYVWKTDILPSEPFWNDWFKGFAQLFISAPTYKVLILPNIDRLDTPFTIGHMSGKFQLEIVHGTNHCMHEDRPDEIAGIVKRFIERMSEIPYWKVPAAK